MKFTLITPTLNAATYLPEALESVRAQDGPDVEHIAVDGGSTDGTLEMLRAEGVMVVRGTDSGVYDAMNRGIEHSTGDIVGFLNADDLLAPGALRAIAETFASRLDSQTVAGGGEVFKDTERGREVLVHVNDVGAKRLREQDVIHGAPILNARFFRRELLERVGAFDTRWKRCADFDFLLRVLDLDPPRAIADQVVYLWRAHDQSLTFRGGIEIDLTEEQLALCTARLAETKGAPGLHARYRRWHSWESAYLAWRRVVAREYGAAARSLVAGVRVDPLLPVHVPVQVAQHLRMRAQHR